jgi:hypothetical protein
VYGSGKVKVLSTRVSPCSRSCVCSAGACEGSPSGAPASTHCAIFATSSSLNDGSPKYSAQSFDACHGGIERSITDAFTASLSIATFS